MSYLAQGSVRAVHRDVIAACGGDDSGHRPARRNVDPLSLGVGAAAVQLQIYGRVSAGWAQIALRTR